MFNKQVNIGIVQLKKDYMHHKALNIPLPVTMGLVLQLDASDIDGYGDRTNNLPHGELVKKWRDKSSSNIVSSEQLQKGISEFYFSS